MVGLLGSGKSFFAEKFSHTFNAPYVDIDRIQKLADDEDLAKRFIDLHLKELFKSKQAIVYEGPTGTKAERTEIAALAKAAGYQALFVWVQTDATSSRNRAEKAGYDEDEIEADAERFEAPDTREKAIVISGKHTFGAQVKAILKKLSTPRAETPLRTVPPSRSASTIRRRI